MGRYIGPKGKLCRREKMDLFLKSSILRKYPKYKQNKNEKGGKTSNRNPSDYFKQLREKQKVKRIYGVLEHQFYRYYNEASKKKGDTGKLLLQFLESRLDNTVYRMGFGSTRAESRQLVSHKAIKVNDKTVNIPSYRLKIKDKVSVDKKKIFQKRIINSINLKKNSDSFASWLSIEFDLKQGFFKELPNEQEISHGYNINESLIIELYSR